MPHGGARDALTPHAEKMIRQMSHGGALRVGKPSLLKRTLHMFWEKD